jgi:hypothetical protein
MDIKKELDIIYNRVYIVKESMSDEDWTSLKEGFEDGITEGIGKWLGKATGWASSVPGKIKDGIKKVSDKTKEAYRKGKEWAKQAIEKAKDWMSEKTKAVKDWMSETANKIKEGFSNFVVSMKNMFSKIGEKLVEYWDAIKDKSKEWSESIVTFFNKMMESAKTGMASFKKWIVEKGASISKWVSENWDKLKAFGEKSKGKFRDLYLKALENLKKLGDKAKGWLDVVILYIYTKPMDVIKRWIKNIPELYEKYKNMISEFIKKQIHEFKLGFEEGSGRPWDRAKGFIEKPTFPEENVKPLDPDKAAAEDEKISKALRQDDMTIDKQSGLSSELGTKLRTPGLSEDEVEAAAEMLVKSPRFKNRYMKYSENDLRSALKNDGMTQIAIDWILYCRDIENSAKKTMALPEKFRYIKTFERFSY